jgi:two-component system OmpR family sensor kinase
MRWRWGWVFLPFVLGLVAALVVLLTDVPNPVLFVQADLWIIILGIGVGISMLTVAIVAIFDRIEKIEIDATIQFAEDRRRFLRRLDHELKNPLTAILAGLANLSIAETSDDRSTSLNSVQTQVSRLRRLVAELRKLSELETRALDLGPIDMTELLEDSFTLAQDHANAGKRVLSLSIPHAPWPLPSIQGDRDLLILAIHNLLDNAIKFSHPGDTIEMRAFDDGDQVIIEVADTGPGILEEDVPHVWEELYRGKGARGIQGSGLGLALVRAIVARHEGEVSLRSRAGEGTVFVLRLPAGQ